MSEHASPLAAIGGVDAGGQNIYVASIARELAKAGHHVDVLTRRDDATLPASVDVRPGFRVIHIPAGPARFVAKEELLQYMPSFARCAEALVRNSARYDVVHANFFMSGLVGLRLKRSFDTPLVVTFHALGLVRREHQGSADRFNVERIPIERRLAHEADRVIAQCPQDRADLMRLYGAAPERISMVPCGVDVAQFLPQSKAAARRALGLSDDDFVVLQLGRLVPRKGIDNVIRAVARLDPRLRAKLLVVGGESAAPDPAATPEIGRLRAIAAGCGVSDRVVFAGCRQRPEVPACYAAADVFVSTPWYEPFGITPIEAMACGTPVIGSAVGGVQYTVVDGVTGYLVPPHDPEALADRLGRLAACPERAEAMGRAGVRRVRAHFTWSIVAEDLLQVYREVARPRAAAPLRQAGAA